MYIDGASSKNGSQGKIDCLHCSRGVGVETPSGQHGMEDAQHYFQHV
jgi:hypothetical protein